MWYMGGKHKQGVHIARFAHHVLAQGQNRRYVEPFCGALGSASRVAHRKMVLNDICKPLMLLWKGLYDGIIELPELITEGDYNRYKRERNKDDPLTALIGFGMSFGWKWFGDYARQNRAEAFGGASGTEAQKTARLVRGVRRKIDAIKSCYVTFMNRDYHKVPIMPGDVVYNDPPYQDRTKAHQFSGKFDYGSYWNWCRSLVLDVGAIILVTSFKLPEDFVVLYDFGDTVVRHHASKGNDGTREVLACHRTQARLFRSVE